MKKVKIGKLYVFDGLKRVEVQNATIGEIVAISGIPDIHIGDTLCSPRMAEHDAVCDDIGTWGREFL